MIGLDASGACTISGQNYPLATGSPNAYTIDVSPNGLFLAAGTISASGNVNIYKIGADGTLESPVAYPLVAGSTFVSNTKISPNGLYCATVNQDTINLFNLAADGSLDAGISRPLPNPAKALAFSPDSSYLYTSNNVTNDIIVFKVGAGGTLDSGTSYPSPSGCTNPFLIAVFPDGKHLAVSYANSSTGSIGIFSIATDGSLTSLNSYSLPSGWTNPLALAVSPNGKYLASSTDAASNIILFKVATDGTLDTGTIYGLTGSTGSAFSIAFSPDGSRLATANGTDTTIFDVDASGNLINGNSYPPPSGSSSPVWVVFSQDSLTCYVASEESFSVSGFTITCPAQTLSPATSYLLPLNSRGPVAVDFSSNGELLGTANYNTSNISIFPVDLGTDLISLLPGTSYPLPSGSLNPSAFKFSHQANYLAATANSGSGDITVFNATVGAFTGKSYKLPGNYTTEPVALDFSPDDAWIAVAASASDEVALFNIAKGIFDGALSHKLPANSTNPVAVAFAPDFTFVATANSKSNDLTIYPFNNGTLGNPISKLLPQGSGCPAAVIFLRGTNGGLLVASVNSCSNDITIFELSETGELSNPQTYKLPLGAFNPQALAVSPNGDYLALTSGGNKIVVFPLNDGVLGTGSTIALPANSTNPVAVAFTSVLNGRETYVASANYRSSDVAVAPLFGGVGVGDGDSGTNNLAIIIPTVIGGALAFTVPVAVIVSYFVYRFIRNRPGTGGVVNWAPNDASAEITM